MRPHAIRTLILLWIALSLCVPCGVWAGGSSTATQNIEELCDFGGKVVPEEALPLVYRTARTTFGRLSEAARSLQSSTLAVIDDIYVIANEAPLISVRTIQPSGISYQRNIVFVSTGLFELFYRPEGTEPAATTLRAGTVRLAGLLAQALAQPFSEREDDDSRSRRQRGFQALQAQADLRAIPILEAAGYPRESLYEGLNRIVSTVADGGRSEVREAMNPEQQRDLRRSLQRLFLTIRRYERGTPEVRYPETQPPGVLRELRAMREAIDGSRPVRPVIPSYNPVADLNAAITEALRLVEANSQSASNVVAQQLDNTILLIDLFLADPTQTIGSDTAVRLATLFTHPQLRHVMGKTLAREVEEARAGHVSTHVHPVDVGILRRTGGRYHSELMEALPIYASPEYVSGVRNHIATVVVPQLRRPYGGSAKVVRELEKMVPASLLLTEFREEVRTRLQEDMALEADEYQRDMNPAVHSLRSWAGEVEPAYASAGAEIFHSDIWPQLPLEKRLDLYTSSKGGFTKWQYDFMLLRVRYEADEVVHGRYGATPRWVRRQLDNPLNASFRESVRRVATTLWERRGELGIMDFLLPDHWVTDWGLIYEMVGLTPAVGRRQLNEAVRQFARSAQYREFIISASRRTLMSDRPASATRSPVPWAEISLVEDLAAEYNEQFPEQARDILRGRARSTFARRLLESSEDAFRQRYAQGLAQALAGRGAEPMTYDEEAALEVTLATSLLTGNSGASGTLPSLADLGSSRGGPQYWGIHRAPHAGDMSKGTTRRLLPAEVADIRARAILRSSLSSENKRELLRDFFLNPIRWQEYLIVFDAPRHWLLIDDSDVISRVLRALRESGAIDSIYDVFAVLRERDDMSHGRRSLYREYFRVVEALDSHLREELSSARNYQDLHRFVHAILAPFKNPYHDEENILINTRKIRELKDAVAAKAATLVLTPEQRLELFWNLTTTGQSSGTDALLKDSQFLASLDTLTSERSTWIRRILLGHRLNSIGLELSMARRLIEPMVASLTQHTVGVRELVGLLEEINRLVPRDSMGKDELLEQIAWDLRLRDRALLNLIEDHKSYNWRRANPMLANWASFFSENVQRLDRNGLMDAIAYFREPEHRPVPASMIEAMRQSAVGRALKLVQESKALETDARYVEENLLYISTRQLETLALNASPTERIPVFDLLLNSGGANGVSAAQDFPLNIIQGHLGYEAGSNNEISLMAFLEVIPQHERTATLAYILSTSGQDKSSIKSLFLVGKAVGVKAAQFAATWKLFSDPNILLELTELKDNADPLTLAEVTQILDDTLSPAERARIVSVDKVLGSASIKTVVQVTLSDGRKAVAALRRPFAAEQIRSNLALAQAYLAKLRERGLSIQAGLLEPMIAAVEEQMTREIDFRIEADQLRYARTFYQSLNSTMRSSLNGWHFEVPALLGEFQVRENLLFMELVEGEAFDALPAGAEKHHVGSQIVESSAIGLLERGWLDADRHARNQRINTATKTISFIDFGQAVNFTTSALPWRSDDRYVLAQFMRALAQRNVTGLIESGLLMARNPVSLTAVQRSTLAARLNAAMASGGDNTQLLVDLLKSFNESGVIFAGRFSFGALKGLMTLYGEDYVSPAEFDAIFERHIRGVLGRKAVRTALDWSRFGRVNPQDCAALLGATPLR